MQTVLLALQVKSDKQHCALSWWSATISF